MAASVKVEDGRTIKYLDQDQVRRFFQAIPAENVRDRLLFGFIYRFGMRVSEAVELPVDAVDRSKAEVTIQGLKGGLLRTYTIPRDLRPLVRKWKPEGETFFRGRQGPLTRVRVWQLFRGYARSAGLPLSKQKDKSKGYNVHSLRHSAAVHALDAGLATEDVRDLLRHKRLATTDVYANLSTKRRNDYLARLEKSDAVVKLR